MSKQICRFAFLASIALVSSAALSAQQTQAPQNVTPPPYSAIPVAAARQTNPVKSSPESLARAKKWWDMDCTMCHGKEGNGKGDLASDIKVKVADFTDPNTLKDRTDGEIFYIIKNGHQDMPAEGERVKPEENWDLVNYVRSLAKPKLSLSKSRNLIPRKPTMPGGDVRPRLALKNKLDKPRTMVYSFARTVSIHTF